MHNGWHLWMFSISAMQMTFKYKPNRQPLIQNQYECYKKQKVPTVREAINNTTTKRRVLCQTFRNYICLIVIVKRIRSADLLQSVRGNRRKKLTCILTFTSFYTEGPVLQTEILSYKSSFEILKKNAFCFICFICDYCWKNIHNTRLILYFFFCSARYRTMNIRMK